MTNLQTDFIGSVELARRKGVSVQTLRRWVKEKKFPAPTMLKPNFAVWPVSVLDIDPRKVPIA